LRPSAEKNGGLRAVLLCAHKRSVTSTITKEKGKVTIWTKGPVVIVRPFFTVNRCKVSSDHHVGGGDRELRDNECVSDFESDHRHSPELGQRGHRLDTGVPGPGIQLFLPSIPLCLAYCLSSHLRFCVDVQEDLPHRGTIPIEQKRVRTDCTSLMGPATCLFYPMVARFLWWWPCGGGPTSPR